MQQPHFLKYLYFSEFAHNSITALQLTHSKLHHFLPHCFFYTQFLDNYFIIQQNKLSQRCQTMTLLQWLFLLTKLICNMQFLYCQSAVVLLRELFDKEQTWFYKK